MSCVKTRMDKIELHKNKDQVQTNRHLEDEGQIGHQMQEYTDIHVHVCYVHQLDVIISLQPGCNFGSSNICFHRINDDEFSFSSFT